MAMGITKTSLTTAAVIVAGLVLALLPGLAAAHCDTLDGPVALDAYSALESGDVTPVLKWVSPDYESEIRSAFAETLAVRGLSSQAQELADTYFIETLVRVHREGEGAPYTGLKSAGVVEPPIAAADAAVAGGAADGLAGTIGGAVEQAILTRFDRLVETRAHMNDSVEAGREYVEAYVTFVHFVEGLHNMVSSSGAHEHSDGH